MKGLTIVIPLLLLFSFACKKPAASIHDDAYADIPPLILRTSLKDTLTKKVLTTLHLNDTEGVKIKYQNGKYASYFTYEADGDVLLRAIASLPFPRYAIKADTICHAISFRDIALLKKNITNAEYEASAFFWDVDATKYDVYECFKPPLRHTLLISKTTQQVLHRAEYIAQL
jgi:hypothetical protein